MTATEQFYTSCLDMALRALRREADLSRATASWLGLASGREFRAVLGAYLAAVQHESAGGEDHKPSAPSHGAAFPSPAEPPSDAGEDLAPAVPNHRRRVPLASEPPSAGGAAWQAHGYSPRRRSAIWTVATSILMAGNERYRAIYLDRKAYERAKAEAEGLIVAPAGKVPASKRAEYRTLGHIDARGRRYAEKKLIADLWRAWHRASEMA